MDTPGKGTTEAPRKHRFGTVLAAVLVVAATAVVGVEALSRINLSNLISRLGDRGSEGETATATAHQDEVLVTTQWLAENLRSPGLVIVEVSEDLSQYDRGHIPGATELEWTEDVVQYDRRDIVTQDEITSLGQRIGLNNESTLIIYGDGLNARAAWAAWIFKYYGAQDVRLLDGGRDKWVAEERPLDDAVPNPLAGNYEASAPNNAIRAYRDEVLGIAENDTPTNAPTLVDVRDPAEFHGAIGTTGQDQNSASGHIPHAVNIPLAQLVSPDGTFRDSAEIAATCAEAGACSGKPVVVYGSSPYLASQAWYALSQVLGYEVKLYDGSWTEWSSLVGAPIETASG